MDKFNVIDQVGSLEDLDNDYVAWSSLPYAFRRHADDDCIRQHGMTNQQYYDQKKAQLLNGTKDAEYIGESYQYNYKLDEDYEKKVDASKQIAISPNINLIIPFEATNMEDLNKSFDSYNYLGYKDRLMSDEYSRQIWGYSVQDIYNYEVERLSDNHEDIPLDESAILSYEAKNIRDITESMIARDDKIGLLQYKIHQYYEDIPKEIHEAYTEYNEHIDDTINQKFDKELYESHMPYYCPFFTPSEIQYNIAEGMDYIEWKEKLLEADKNDDGKALLELGWNPSVKLNKQNIEYARQRQINWLEHHIPKIIDIQNINNKFDEEAITESTENMRELYKTKDLYPIFIVLSFTNTPFGNIIKTVKGSTYTHAGISTDSSLDTIYSFNFGKEYNGFVHDSLDKYMSVNKNAIVDVLCIFVDGKTKFKIDATLNEFERNKQSTRYSFGNIINMLFNRAKNYPYPENLALVCSQFVDLILKLANIDLIDKPNNLVLPQDFAELSSNPKVYKVYEGYARNYKEFQVEKDIGVLFMHRKIVDIKYNAGLKIDFSKINNKAGVIETLNTIDDLLMPRSILVERYIPIKVKDNGDLSIEFSKDLEQQYQESHKLLTTYDKENLYGIKHELAHLFYMNSQIENKIKKMKKNDPEYQTLINLRARILNDFKTYLKIVNKEDPDFDFSKYFQDSEYYNGAITIDHGLMKLSGKIIQKIISRGLK